ncbi:MAG TPA: hypothetical protein VG937_02410 [Polyangiaceae bacterium]|nr:hypothetical protein [Polyangiaceae bacterium]
MNREKLLKPVLMAALAALLGGCGGTDPEGNTESTGTGPLLPVAVGNSWEYRVTDKDGVVTQKRTTVLDQEAVGGTGPNAAVMAFKVVTRKGADLNTETGLDKTESWQGPDPKDSARIVRYRELSYGAMTQLLQLEEFWQPPRIHIDGSQMNTKAGAMWIETYVETKLPVGDVAPAPSEESDYWSVISPDEAIEVPNGRFEHTVHVRKIAATGGNEAKDYWYLRGVGKIKESGAQTEELTHYTVDGVTK